MDQLSRKVIVLNGPPRAGKDTAIEILEKVFNEAEVYQFFRPIKELLHEELGLDVPYNHYESLKDQILPEFNFMTPRLAYIDKGDRLQRELGYDILTDIYFTAISNCNAPVLITTCGKDSEAVLLADMFGVENTLFLRIHREGKSFKGDSRSWVSSSHLNIQDVHNEPDQVREYQERVAEIARVFVNPRLEQAFQAA